MTFARAPFAIGPPLFLSTITRRPRERRCSPWRCSTRPPPCTDPITAHRRLREHQSSNGRRSDSPSSLSLYEIADPRHLAPSALKKHLSSPSRHLHHPPYTTCKRCSSDIRPLSPSLPVRAAKCGTTRIRRHGARMSWDPRAGAPFLISTAPAWAGKFVRAHFLVCRFFRTEDRRPHELRCPPGCHPTLAAPPSLNDAAP